MNIKVGCSGFQEARSKYYNEFQMVEVQQTFLQPPPLGTVFKWRNQAPRDFEFTVRAWQIITHEPTSPSYQNLRETLPARALAGCGFFKPTRIVMEAWQRTDAIAEALKSRVIVFQTPKDFTQTPFNIRNFKNFFRRINRKKYYFVWEPGDKWHPNTIRELCSELDLIYSADPLRPNYVSHGPIQYFRLRGKAGFRSRYIEDDFSNIFASVKNGRPTYFVLNNASMLFDARNFQKYVQEHPIIVPTISPEAVALAPTIPTVGLDQFEITATSTNAESRPADEPLDTAAETAEELNLVDFSEENGVAETLDELIPTEVIAEVENHPPGETDALLTPPEIADPTPTDDANDAATTPLTETTTGPDSSEASATEAAPESNITTTGTTSASAGDEAAKSDEKSETTTESSIFEESGAASETSK